MSPYNEKKVLIQKNFLESLIKIGKKIYILEKWLRFFEEKKISTCLKYNEDPSI